MKKMNTNLHIKSFFQRNTYLLVDKVQNPSGEILLVDKVSNPSEILIPGDVI
jgi:hypothetical protein